MEDEILKCAKCGGEMETGFVPDYTHGGILNLYWHPGDPEPSFWFGTKVEKNELIPVQTYRCEDCGYLEFYAEIKK